MADFFNNMKNRNTIADEDDEGTLLDQVSPDLPFAQSYLQSLQPSNVTGANQITEDDLMDLEEGVEPGFSPLQARDGGRIQYMDGGLTDLVDIYD